MDTSIDPKKWEQQTVEESFQALESSSQGLTTAEASKRLETFGLNALEEHDIPLWKRLISYFWGPIPWMIEAAALLFAINSDWKSFGVIFAMLLIHGGIVFSRGLPFLIPLTFLLLVLVTSIPVAMPVVLSVTMVLGTLSLSRMKEDMALHRVVRQAFRNWQQGAKQK
ncbi:MAG: hypothetical protein JJ693_03910 [Acidithiobacillus sp.]|nr:hypothetical protein [Acidithiobacillus sp.]